MTGLFHAKLKRVTLTYYWTPRLGIGLGIWWRCWCARYGRLSQHFGTFRKIAVLVERDGMWFAEGSEVRLFCDRVP